LRRGFCGGVAIREGGELMRKRSWIVLAALLAAAAGGCADEPEAVLERGEASYYDGDVHDFLPDYIDEHPMFTDNELDYWVKEGRVSARGALDTEEERGELERRIRRVPGVRDVDVTGIAVGSR
jgi:hypothetical protein